MRHDLSLVGLSARNRAILARGVRGGSEDAPTIEELLAQTTPEAAAALDDEQLGALHDRLQAEAIALLSDPAKASDDDLATAEKIDAAMTLIETVQGERAQAAAERTAKASELLDKIKGQTGDGGDGEGDADKGDAGDADKGDDADKGAGDGGDAGDKGAGDGGDGGDAAPDKEVEVNVEDDQPEKIAAAAKKNVVTRVSPRSPSFMAPRKRETATPNMSALRASANTPNFGAGEVLDTPEKRAVAFCSAIKASMGYRGARVEMPVMSAGVYDPTELYGEGRTLDDNARGNEKKIDSVTSRAALKASGGKCAPSQVFYDWPTVGSTDRPVKDALANFGADRGGVRLIPPPTIAAMAGGVAAWTNANDITPSSPATKPCITMTCPSDVETLVEAITQCIKIGNFRAKYFSEQVDAWIEKSLVYTARFAESRLLTSMGGLMTNVSVGSDLGTTRSVLAGLDRASAGLRGQLRLDPDFPLRFIGPSWLLDNMISDLSREQPGASTERLATSDTEINGFLAAKAINASWTLDGEAGQIMPDQADGALNGWPSHAIGYLFIEGEMLYLDGGEIKLGTVRDSTLVGTNDAIMFSEFMENVAFHGNKAYRMDFDICPNGQTSLPVAFDPCTTGS